MCTVTFLPTGNHTFFLTSSRDERIDRKPAGFPVTRPTSIYKKVLFPQDGDKGGTWIASSDTLTVCLLNGAFKNHASVPPYRISRGLVVLTVFDYASVEAFLKLFDLNKVEPFTMIFVQHAEKIVLTELRWDGQQKHVTVKDARQPHIWSSATLYDHKMMEERESWFSQWLQQEPLLERLAVRNFHYHGGQADQTYNIRMNRPGLVSTVSITTIEAEVTMLTMYYEDLAKEEKAQASISRIAYAETYE
jgi:hypothetical protein